MRKLLLTSLLSLIGSPVIGGCQTTGEEGESAALTSSRHAGSGRKASFRRSAKEIKAATVLPEAFGAPLTEPEAPRLLIPAAMLAISQVVRPKAEVRSGPGIQFELADKVLARGTRVLAFEQVGVWRKIVVMATSQAGWVHGQTLSPPKPSRVPMLVDARRLPTVLAVREVEQVKSFPAQAAVKTKVPKGAMFRSLMYADAGTLVLLPETSSVMWISGKDVK